MKENVGKNKANKEVKKKKTSSSKMLSEKKVIGTTKEKPTNTMKTVKKDSEVVVSKNKKKVNKKASLKEINFRKFFTKVNVTYFILFLLDIVLVIYSARQNIVNYVVVLDEEIFVSETKYLLWGRNYINLLIIGFFYVYICLMNKFFLHRKNTKKFLIWLFGILVFVNVLLFVLFTKRVY